MNKANKQKPTSMSTGGLGLENLGDLSALLNEPAANTSVGDGSGRVLLRIDLIDEDPDQPRKETNPGFSKEKLGELAGAIEHRGVKTPISVRHHPLIEDRYMINDGARRYRASKIAGLTEIPVNIDDDYTPFDQIVANLIREGNTPKEIAEKIGIALKQGMKKIEIAAASGKTPAWVTLHATLLNLPKPIDDAFNDGRISDINIVYELVKIYKTDAEEVEKWLSIEDQEFTRGQLKLFREFLADKHSKQEEDEVIHRAIVSPDSTGFEQEEPEHTSPIDTDGLQVGDSDIGTNNTPKRSANDDDDELSNVTDANATNNSKPVTKPAASTNAESADKFKKAIVIVEHDGRPARLVLDRKPPNSGWAWLKYEDDGHVFEASLATVSLIELVEG